MTANIVELNDATGRVVGIWSQPRGRKTRVYTSCTEDEVRERFGLERPAYSIRGEDTESDKAWRKYNRAEIAIMRERAEDLLRRNKFSLTGLRFSRKAGCGCGCSPGFVLGYMVLTGRGDGTVFADLCDKRS